MSYSQASPVHPRLFLIASASMGLSPPDSSPEPAPSSHRASAPSSSCACECWLEWAPPCLQARYGVAETMAPPTQRPRAVLLRCVRIRPL